MNVEVELSNKVTHVSFYQIECVVEDDSLVVAVEFDDEPSV